MGVWIETFMEMSDGANIKSHPSWVCGLKHDAASLKEVEPKSHPSWVCGLKLPGSYQRAGA